MKRYQRSESSLVARYPRPVEYESSIDPEKLKKAIIQMQSGFSVRFVPAVYDAKNNEFYLSLKKGGAAAKISGRMFEELQTYPKDFEDLLWCYPLADGNIHPSDKTAILVMTTGHPLPNEVTLLLNSVERIVKLGSPSFGNSGEIEFG